jgi:hypothetical protein
MAATGKDVVGEARRLLQARLAELDEEKARLERALADLTGGKRRGPGRPKGSRNSGRRRSGTRAEQAVKLVKANPGISAGEIAKRMSIAPNYVYRVMAELEKEGRVNKSGRQYSAP